MKVLNKFQKWWIKFRQLIHCPFCHQIIKPKWVKDVVLFEDEPPMFFHYECPKCYKIIQHTQPTILTEQTVRRLGYKDFKDYARKNLKV